MKKRAAARWILAVLCLALMLSPAGAETREGVIMLEGMEEPIEETLFQSSQGFSFWYANEGLEAYEGERDNIEGVIVTARYSDDYMILSMIPQEDAEEYAEDLEGNILEQAAAARVTADVYRELEDGEYYFLTLIAENGQYFRAVGQYSQEAAEGNAKYFDRLLGSVAFTSGCPIHAEWGTQEADEEGRAQVILTAAEPVTDAALLRLDWDGAAVSWTPDAALGSLTPGQPVSVTLTFMGDMPENGIRYTDEAGVAHAFALDISGEDGQLFFWELEE